MAALQLKLFGGFSARLSTGERLAVPSRKGQILLALLALRSGEKLAREKVIGLLWSDRGDSQARGSLRQELTTLRKILSMVEPQPILIEGEWLQLQAGVVDVDVLEFEKLIRSDSAPDLDRAVSLYRGPFLGELMVRDSACAEWLFHERERLRTLALGGIDRLMTLRMREGSLEQAVGLAETLLSHDPLREHVHRCLMELYARLGRYGSALKQYRVCQSILVSELAVEPEPATTRLYEEIRQRRAASERSTAPEGTTHGGADPAGTQMVPAARDIASQMPVPSIRASAEAAQLYQMGRSFFLRNIWGKRALEAARQLFRQAIDADPRHARAYAGLADCECYRLLLGLQEASIEDINANCARALELDPDSPEALAAKGLALYVAGEHAEASTYFERAITLGPELFEAHYFYARNCRVQGQHDKAAQQFERAASLNRNDYRAIGLLSDEYRSLGRLGDSLAAARSCLERVSVEVAAHPDDGHALSFGAIILAELGEWGRAEEWLARARGVDPDDPIVNYNLACAFAQLGRSEAGIERLQAAFAAPDINRRAFFEWLRTDSAFDPIRAHPDFRSLVGRLEAEILEPGAADQSSERDATQLERVAIAVLPFANISGDPAIDLHAEGLTEDIITDLSRILGLSVISRSAVAPYAGRKADVREVARALSVRFVLEGTVRRSEGEFSVTAQLVDGYAASLVWGGRFEQRIEDTLKPQNEISQSIVSALIVNLLPTETIGAAKLQTSSPEAYRHYLTGRSNLLMRGGGIERLMVARQAFAKAFEIDPKYARALAGIANADSLRLWRGDISVSIEQILDTSERALELDPESAEAHVAKGLALYMAGQHARAAEPLALAVRLGPSLFEAHLFAGRNFRVLGRNEEAVALLERAGELEPDHYRALGLAVGAYAVLDRREDMLSAATRCIDRCQAEIRLHPDNADATTFGAAVLAEAGLIEDAREWIARAEALQPTDAVASYNIAAAHAAIGQSEPAIQWLTRVCAEPYFARRVHVEWLAQDKSFDRIRDRPEFALFMQRLEEDRVSHDARQDRRPAIAVLPFENLGGELEQVYFADGLVDEIIAALSRVRSFFVIARGSTLRYRDRKPDAAMIGRELGVRYLLEGSVRRFEDRIRVWVQLVDATTGESIWAERFERKPDAVFDLQDEITQRTVGAIEPTIRSAEIERARRKRSENLEAYDYVMRALSQMLTLTRSAGSEALALASEAARIDPGYARAHALAAWCHAWQLVNDWVRSREQTREAGIRHMQRALHLDSDDPSVLVMVGAAEMNLIGDIESAAIHVEKALSIDPNSAWGWIRSGYIKAYFGQTEAALERFEKAGHLSPFDPLNFNLYTGRALAHFVAGRYLEATGWAEMALAERPGLPWGYRLLVASQQMLGRTARAEATVQLLLDECPSLSVASALECMPFRNDDARQRFMSALREAGLPENSPQPECLPNADWVTKVAWF